MLAKAASAEPMAKVSVMVLSTLMPIRIEALLSSETARMALPSLVRSMNSVRPIMIAAVTASVISVMPSTVTPPTVKPGSVGMEG